MEKPRQDRLMTAFLVFVGIALAVGLLSIRYGVDSRIDKRNL
jgi:cytochrome c-type biogenesis protein CcmE